jgi:hypothetical protein
MISCQCLLSLHVLLQVKFDGFTGQGLGTLGWALARMDVKPRRMWVQVRSKQSQQSVPCVVSWSSGKHDKTSASLCHSNHSLHEPSDIQDYPVLWRLCCDTL